jgi:hypothetical protein
VALSKVTLTGTFTDGQGTPVAGKVAFAPNTPLTDPADDDLIRQVPVTATLDASGHFSVSLIATDYGSIQPAGWAWVITESITGAPPRRWSFFLAHANGATQDLSALGAIPAVAPSSLPLSTLGDLLYENATPALARLAGNTAATKKFLTQTGTGAISAAPAWGTLAAGDLPAATSSTLGAVQIAGDLSGTATSPQVPSATTWINVRKAPYSAAGDGTTDDTSAINAAVAAAAAAAVPVYFPAATYKITSTLNWKIAGLQVRTDGAKSTIISQATANTPILQVAGQGQRIGGLTLTYTTQQTSAQTSAIGVEFGDDSVGSCFMSAFDDLRVNLSNTGLAINPAVTTVAGLFSCAFGNIEILGYSVSAIRFRGSIGANCTGCTFGNVYVHNNFTGSDTNSTSWPLDFQNWDEVVFDQINVEHAQVFNSDAAVFAHCGNVVINAAHFEHLEMSGTPGFGLIAIGTGTGSVLVNGLSVRFCTFTGASYNSVARVTAGTGQSLVVNGLSFPASDSGLSTPALYLLDFNSATSVTARFYGINATASQLYTANTVNAGTGCVAQVGATLDAVPAPAANVSLNSHKITSLANGTAATDAAAFGQIPVADTTAADITPSGAQAAGSTGKWADAGHIHPANGWIPADNALLTAQGGDPGLVTSTAITTAGTLYLVKLPIRYAITITNLVVLVSSAASGTSTTTFCGLYNSAGTLLSGSADVGTPLKSAGAATLPLTTPQSLSAGTFVWAALLTNFGTTQPTLFKGGSISNNVPNLGLSAAASRWAINGTGLSALPGSITPASNSITGALTLWCGAT